MPHAQAQGQAVTEEYVLTEQDIADLKAKSETRDIGFHFESTCRTVLDPHTGISPLPLGSYVFTFHRQFWQRGCI